MKLTRRQWLASIGAVGLAGVGAYAFAGEPYRVTITRHRIGPRSSTRPRLRMVQLSDLHLRRVGPRERRIARAVASLAPTVIVITGDSIDRRNRLGALAAFLDLLDRATPKYAILGNWEHWVGVDLGRLRRIYEMYNCLLLCNESATFASAAGELLITGVDDLIGGVPDLDRALVGAGPMRDTLLLAHCPTYRDVVMRHARGAAARSAPARPGHADWYVPDLQLSGHTHAGQVTVLGKPVFLPRGSGRYVSGWYRARGFPMYVSRGLGTSGIPARLGAPPEIAYFEWTLIEGRRDRGGREG